jgi:clan AA aspartic protease (TIGR02281 family)
MQCCSRTKNWMRLARNGWYTVVSLCAILILATELPTLAQESAKPSKNGSLPEDVSRVLSENGLRLVGSSLTLDLDTQIAKEVKDLAKFKKALMFAERDRIGAEAEVEYIKQNISELRKRQTLLSAQLANVKDVLTNNRIVGELNTAKGLMESLAEQRDEAAKKAKTARSKVNEIQEDFVETLLRLRQESDDAHHKWEALSADQEVIEAVEKAGDQTGKKLVIQPSATLELVDKQLKKYEESVISETIALANEGNSFWVNVEINGKPVERMVVDSGASALCLSMTMAKKLDVAPQEANPDVAVRLADGREIPGKIIRLSKVRVGKFTAENVDCIVLGEQAVDAPPLLGMSFLGQFKFELDAAQSQLRIIRVDSGEPVPATNRAKKQTK